MANGTSASPQRQPLRPSKKRGELCRLENGGRQDEAALFCLIFDLYIIYTLQLSITRKLIGLQVAILFWGFALGWFCWFMNSCWFKTYPKLGSIFLCPQDWLIFFLGLLRTVLLSIFSIAISPQISTPADSWVLPLGNRILHENITGNAKNPQFIRWFPQHFPAINVHGMFWEVPGITPAYLACARWRSGSTSSSCWSSLARETHEWDTLWVSNMAGSLENPWKSSIDLEVSRWENHQKVVPFPACHDGKLPVE